MQLKLENMAISKRTVEWLRYWTKDDVPVVCAEHKKDMPRKITNRNAQESNLGLILISYVLFLAQKKSNYVNEICS